VYQSCVGLAMDESVSLRLAYSNVWDQTLDFVLRLPVFA